MSGEWFDVAAAGAIAPGGFEIIDVDDVLIAVFNLDGEFYAIEDVCTHDGEELTGGPVIGDEIICPRHGARFCIKTGAVTAPPAYEPVPTYPVRVVEGRVQVQVDIL
ncbi:MAG: non-heme iron oxygenase ferredoxin subunit [Gammaproteobacteria bacterium]|nr:non-heme iron oxygenase ferredoxin subunit [Gammaproteobacteria bacterium]